MRKGLLLALLIGIGCVPAVLLAQTKTIRGTVYTTDNTPLAGVSVSIRSVEKSVLTNMNGEYSIEMPDSTGVLQFSAIGYIWQEVQIGTRMIVNVYLPPRPLVLKIDNLIDTIVQPKVAIGYGTEERWQVMSSIVSVSAEEIAGQPVASLQQAIQARLAGTHITQNSGTPAGGVGIRVRGTTSVNFGSEPLYVIDGIPINSYTNFSNISRLNGVQQGNNYLATINHMDIASVDVLKDAAAASIYGSRAASGVILITTKRGKAQKTRVSLDASYGIQEVPTRLPLLNTTEYIALLEEAYANANTPLPNGFRDNSVNTDWQSALFRQVPIQQYNLSIQGGTDKTQFFASGGYFSQKGVVVGSDFNRYHFRLNLDQRFNSRFRVGNSLMFSQNFHQRLQEDLTGNAVLVHLPLARPNLALYTPTGEYQTDPLLLTRDNPLATAETVKDEAIIRRLISNLYAEYQIGNYWLFRSSLGIDWITTNEAFFRPPNTTVTGRNTNGTGIAVQMTDFSWVFENTLQFKRIFYTRSALHKHEVNFLVGTGVQQSSISRIQAAANNFASEKVFSVVAGSIKTPQTNSSQEYWGMVSYFSRLHYSFNQKYFLSFNFRIDGSSRFATNRKFAAFPSASVGWLLSEEPFLKRYTWLHQLKLRTSWGLMGNQEIGNYTWQGLYVTGQSYIGLSGFTPSSIPNPNLGWETTEQYNVGLDLHLFKNRVAIVFDYYLKNTRDLLVNVNLPTSTGFDFSLQNAGAVQNKGLEIDLTTKNVVGVLNWTTRFNIAFNQNKVLTLPSRIPAGVGGFSNMTLEGYPIGSFWGTKLISRQPDPQTGNFVFEDLNQNGNTFNDPEDRQVIGTPHPVFTGGLSNILTFKGFDLHILAQFVYGNDIFDFTRSRYEGMQGGNNGSKRVLERWRKAGDLTTVPRAIYNDFSNGPVSDVWLQKGSFLRLQTVSLGYALPQQFLQKIRTQQLRLFITLQNVYTFTPYNGGYDPEVNTYSQSNTANGVEYGSYPKARAYLMGLTISF